MFFLFENDISKKLRQKDNKDLFSSNIFTLSGRNDDMSTSTRGNSAPEEMSTTHLIKNKAGYTATEVACGWAGTIFEVTRPFGQKQ